MRDAAARALREDEHVDAPAPRRLRLVEAGSEADYAPTYAENGRRTITITGSPARAAGAHRPVAQRSSRSGTRRRSAAASQIEARPDRIALWAVLLGLFLVFMAVATANAAAI